MARPIDTRCISPPDSLAVLRVSRWVMRSTPAISSTRFLISGSGVLRMGERSGKARLSKTVMFG